MRRLLALALPFRLLFAPAFRARQVEVGADDAHDRAAGFPAHWEAAREDVDVVAVLVAQPELYLRRSCAPRGETLVEALRASCTSSGWISRSQALTCGSISWAS